MFCISTPKATTRISFLFILQYNIVRRKKKKSILVQNSDKMDLFLKYLSSARNGEDTWLWNVLYTCGSNDRGVAEKSLLKGKKNKSDTVNSAYHTLFLTLWATTSSVVLISFIKNLI